MSDQDIITKSILSNFRNMYISAPVSKEVEEMDSTVVCPTKEKATPERAVWLYH
jgi:hypothetical protein